MKLNYENMSDNELYKLLNDKDREKSEKSFIELYNRYSKRIYMYCKKIMGDVSLAKDAFQDTFVTFFNESKVKEDIQNISAFLYRVAHNKCLNSMKKEKYLKTVDDFIIPVNDFNPDKDELLALISTAVDLLPLEFREVFVLKEYDGMTYSGIAEMLGIPESTVKIRSHRARQKIRKILSPYLADLSK